MVSPEKLIVFIEIIVQNYFDKFFANLTNIMLTNDYSLEPLRFFNLYHTAMLHIFLKCGQSELFFDNLL